MNLYLPIGCQNVLLNPQLQDKKYWWVSKKVPSKNKWFRFRLQFCFFSGLVIGWWSKLRAAPPYPNRIWVPSWWVSVVGTTRSGSLASMPWTGKFVCRKGFCCRLVAEKLGSSLCQKEWITKWKGGTWFELCALPNHIITTALTKKWSISLSLESDYIFIF